jgi:hypothetical protein
MATSPVNAVNTIGKCQLCGSMRQTSPVEYNRNIGMLFLRQTRKVNARMCKTCARKNFWDFQVKNLLLGPWGIISLVITPIYLITNTVSYASALKELKSAVE